MLVSIDHVIEALEAKGCEPKQHGKEWIAKCPAHDDQKPSFGASVGEDGRVLVKCLSGCEFPAIAAALGLAATDFFAAKAKIGKEARRKPKLLSQIEWPIKDERGQVLAVHRRFNYDDGSKKVLWFLPDGLTPSRKGEPGAVSTEALPLYGAHRLPKLTTVPIFVTEGEKAADMLDFRGFAAVGSVTGASGTPCDASLSLLKGRHVLLWPDHDDVGRGHMARIGARLLALGATSVRLIFWPDGHFIGGPRAKDDAYDFFNRGGTEDHVRLLIEQAVDFQPPDETPVAKPAVRILVPGSHWTDDGYVERGTHVFVDDVLSRLPKDTFCRLGQFVGRLSGEQGAVAFKSLSVDAVRLLVDSHVSLERSTKGEHDRVERTFCAATRDHGNLVLAGAADHPSAPQLAQIVRYPVFLPDWSRAKPGWNAGGVYYDEPEVFRGIEPSDDTGPIFDALIDFPFKDDASRMNAVGFMLSPLIRPAVGNLPLHLVHAAQERTGKTKLVELMAALVVNLPELPPLRLDAAEEEVDKRILAMLRDSPAVIHLDNINRDIDSAALASLITSASYSGRPLSTSTIVTLPNRVCLIATGNNVSLSSEMAKRTIPILLQATSADPEARTDFVHPDLAALARTHRRPVVAALLGLVEHWKARGRPPGQYRFGGFEAWMRAVGGILEGSDWYRNVVPWQRSADPAGADLAAFVTLWAAHPNAAGSFQAKALAAMCAQAGLFPHFFAKGEHSGSIIFAKQLLKKSVDRFVGQHVIRRQGSGSSSFWRLEAVANTP